MVILFLVLNVVAFPGSLVAGYFADRFGPKRTLVGSLWLWVVTILVGFAAQDRATFYLMACLAALGMGSTQAVSRSFMAQITLPLGSRSSSASTCSRGSSRRCSVRSSSASSPRPREANGWRCSRCSRSFS